MRHLKEGKCYAHTTFTHHSIHKRHNSTDISTNIHSIDVPFYRMSQTENVYFGNKRMLLLLFEMGPCVWVNFQMTHFSQEEIHARRAIVEQSQSANVQGTLMTKKITKNCN